MKRKIIKIDEAKCNGCGQCIPDCPEGALAIVNGKVRLVKDSLCDGLGVCVGRCPFGALTIEEREAAPYDEEEVQSRLAQANPHFGCPGLMARHWEPKSDSEPEHPGQAPASALRQWPVQLHLLSPRAPYFQDADLLIAADCVAFSFADFHRRFLAGKTLVIFCPKLDNSQQLYVDKLTAILLHNNIKTITTVHMQVPCCSGTVAFVEEAVKLSGKSLPIKDYTISLQGDVL